jgi:hypothetical protein
MLTQRQKDFLDKYTRGVWKINPLNGLVDIDGDFFYSISNIIVKSPLRGIRFGEVTGDFYFEAFPSYLDDFSGFPYKVGGNFSGSRNNVISLKGGPKEVGGNYKISFNRRLKNFEYAPERINGDFVCRFTRDLESFEGLPKYIGGDLNLTDGNPWQQKIDTNNLILVYQSEIAGSIRFDGAYRKVIEYIKGLALPGISTGNIISAMSKRGIIFDI